jgi:hypothetical protein
MTTTQPIDPTFAGCLLLAGGGAAVASGALTLPGGSVTTNLGTLITVTRTGTATIKPRAAPRLSKRCLHQPDMSERRHLPVPGGKHPVHQPRPTPTRPDRRVSITVSLDPGQHTVTVRANRKATWTLQADYVRQTTTARGVNAHGQTYGVANSHGTPDLIAVDTVTSLDTSEPLT